MGFSDQLLERSRSPSAIFHRYRVDPSISERPHIFVEGYDDLLFYGLIARHTLGDRAKFHLCYGKRNLDKIYALFKESEFDHVGTLFLRDSDFDLYLGKVAATRHLFLTAGYAVENYVCCPQAISSLIVVSFGLDQSEFNADVEVKQFQQHLEEIFAWLEPIHGAIFKAIHESRILDLDQLRFDEYFGMILTGRSLPDPKSLAELSHIGLDDNDFSQDSLALAEKFNQQHCFQWLGGKYLITALSVFLKHLEPRLRALHKSKIIRQFNKRVHPDFSPNILFERIIGHVKPDNSLMDALKKLSSL
jgi:hypothetical protein